MIDGVHIWRAALDNPSWPGAAELPPEERERAARFLREEVKRRWVASRWALRRVLGDYLGVEPAAVELEVDGRTVRLVFDREARDVYGRLLAYVYTRGRFVNAALVRGGYARTLTIAPNTSHAPEFHRLAAEAARAGRGLWGAC